LNSICLPRIDEAPEETWHVETAKVDCLNEPSFQEWPTMSSDKVQGELGSCVAQVNLPTMFAKQEELKPLCDSFNLFIAPEQYQDTVYAFLFFFSLLVVMLNAFLCSWLQGICLFIPYIF
jgi:hypothetical protein